MLSKTFVFSKLTKTAKLIEDDLNKFLLNHTLKFATQNESYTKGKFIITLFVVPEKSTMKAKVFKDQNIDKLDIEVNKFLKNNSMKYVTQTFVGSNVYTIIFYDNKTETTPTVTNTSSTSGQDNGKN